jgi:hypothetical protein
MQSSSKIKPSHSSRPEVEPGTSRFKGLDGENRVAVNEYILEMIGKGLFSQEDFRCTIKGGFALLFFSDSESQN